MNLTNPAPSLTILRLKRKRTEEPLDALVVEQMLSNGVEHGKKKPKKRGSINKEQFSPLTETEQEAKSPLKEPSTPFMFRFAETVEKVSFNDSIKTRQLQDRISKLISSKQNVIKRFETKKFREDQIAKFNENRRKERYKVIDRNRRKGIESASTAEGDENEMINDMFMMYDAVKEEEIDKSVEGLKITNDDDDDDSDIMCNFIPLVKQYLTIQDDEIEDDPGKKDDKSDEDYVYDVYYRDDSTTLLDDEIQHQNFATLTWFDGSENEIFLKETSKNQELYEYSDEEDSNAEDYYTHDYPEGDNDDDYDYNFDDNWNDDDDYSSDEQDYYH